MNKNQDKATKPQAVQIVRQGEPTLYWFLLTHYKYEVEFVGGKGETLALLALNGKSDLKRAAVSESLPENPNKAAPVVGTARQEAT